jgi:hypothetical protein
MPDPTEPEALDVTVSADAYVTKKPRPDRDGIVTYRQGKVIGRLQPVVMGPVGNKQVVWVFKAKEER